MTKKLFLIKLFGILRDQFRSSIESFKDYNGNPSYIVNAMLLVISMKFLSSTTTSDFNTTISLLYNEIKMDCKNDNDLKSITALILFLAETKDARGFNIPLETLKVISNPFIRRIFTLVCDYLIYPDCIDDYPSYAYPYADQYNVTSIELFEWLSEDISFINDYIHDLKLPHYYFKK